MAIQTLTASPRLSLLLLLLLLVVHGPRKAKEATAGAGPYCYRNNNITNTTTAQIHPDTVHEAGATPLATAQEPAWRHNSERAWREENKYGQGFLDAQREPTWMRRCTHY